MENVWITVFLLIVIAVLVWVVAQVFRGDAPGLVRVPLGRTRSHPGLAMAQRTSIRCGTTGAIRSRDA